MRPAVWLLALSGCGRWGFATERDATASGDGRHDDANDTVIDTQPDAETPCTPLALSDDFNDGVAASAWMVLQNNPVTVAEAGGTLGVTLATSGGSHYGGYDSNALFDLRDHCMWVSYLDVPTNEALVEMSFAMRTPIAATGFVYHLGVLDPFVNTGTFTSLGSVTYDAAVHKVVRVREDSGTMTWQVSTDGITFTTLATRATPIDVSAATIVIEAGTFGSAPNPGMAHFDNFDN